MAKLNLLASKQHRALGTDTQMNSIIYCRYFSNIDMIKVHIGEIDRISIEESCWKRAIPHPSAAAPAEALFDGMSSFYTPVFCTMSNRTSITITFNHFTINSVI